MNSYIASTHVYQLGLMLNMITRLSTRVQNTPCFNKLINPAQLLLGSFSQCSVLQEAQLAARESALLAQTKKMYEREVALDERENELSMWSEQVEQLESSVGKGIGTAEAWARELEIMEEELQAQEKELLSRADELEKKVDELVDREEHTRTMEVQIMDREAECKVLEKNLEDKALALFSKEISLDARAKRHNKRLYYLLDKQQRVEEEIKRQIEIRERQSKEANDYMNVIIHKHKEQFDREKKLYCLERDTALQENAIADMMSRLDERQTYICTSENRLAARETANSYRENALDAREAAIAQEADMVKREELDLQHREANINAREQNVQTRESLVKSRELEAASVMLREHLFEQRESNIMRRETRLNRAERGIQARDTRTRKQQRVIAKQQKSLVAQTIYNGTAFANMARGHTRGYSSDLEFEADTKLDIFKSIYNGNEKHADSIGSSTETLVVKSPSECPISDIDLNEDSEGGVELDISFSRHSVNSRNSENKTSIHSLEAPSQSDPDRQL